MQIPLRGATQPLGLKWGFENTSDKLTACITVRHELFIPKLSVSNYKKKNFLFSMNSIIFNFKNLKPQRGLPILPHLRCQMPFRIGNYSGATSSLQLRQPRQSLNLGLKLSDSNHKMASFCRRGNTLCAADLWDTVT